MIRIIALIKQSEIVVGLRLYHEKTGECRDFKYVKTLEILKNKGCVNIDLRTKQPTENSIGRFPLIVDGVIDKPYKLSIIGMVGDKYKVVNLKGRAEIFTERELINTINSWGYNDVLVNGKVVTKEGKSYISAIKGEFRKLESEEQVAKQEVKQEVKQEARVSGFYDNIFYCDSCKGYHDKINRKQKNICVKCS